MTYFHTSASAWKAVMEYNREAPRARYFVGHARYSTGLTLTVVRFLMRSFAHYFFSLGYIRCCNACVILLLLGTARMLLACPRSEFEAVRKQTRKSRTGPAETIRSTPPCPESKQKVSSRIRCLGLCALDGGSMGLVLDHESHCRYLSQSTLLLSPGR